MKLLPVLIVSGLANLASAAVGGKCVGNLAHPCICLDKDLCKNYVHGTPIETENSGNYPCPADAGNIWGCYIYC